MTQSNKCEERIAIVENQLRTQEVELHKVRNATHDHANMLMVMQSTLERMEQVNATSSQRFEHHMEKEEEAFSRMYRRLRSLDESLISSFKERDDKLHVLDKAQVRLLAYATAAFAVITVVADFAVGSLT